MRTKADCAPWATRLPVTVFAVTSPRSPGPSGLQARRQRIPRVAKFSKAPLEKLPASAWQALIVNSPAAAGRGATSVAAATMRAPGQQSKTARGGRRGVQALHQGPPNWGAPPPETGAGRALSGLTIRAPRFGFGFGGRVVGRGGFEALLGRRWRRFWLGLRFGRRLSGSASGEGDGSLLVVSSAAGGVGSVQRSDRRRFGRRGAFGIRRGFALRRRSGRSPRPAGRRCSGRSRWRRLRRSSRS